MITEFTFQWRFLSNFYPIKVEYDHVQYPSVEHAYQAAKTEDVTSRTHIANAQTAGQAKRLGQKVKLRKDWEIVKLDIMEDLLRHKFSIRRYPVMAHLLESTGKLELIEGNNWGDMYWGMMSTPDGYRGKNMLGKLLMKVREQNRVFGRIGDA